MAEKNPIITAKKWAISNQKQGLVEFGKGEDEQCEVASMTKVCTALTVVKLMDFLCISDIAMSKNIYLRVGRKAAYMTGTSAYVQWDNRISLYDCLHALMLPSGNDAAIVLATEFGRWLFFN
jgi:D-alanyl-D-alanine carboxypeptidase